MEEVYHYTGASSLLGIVEKGRLWASAASTLNDLSEVLEGRSFLKSYLASDISERPSIGNLRDQTDFFTEDIIAQEPDRDRWRTAQQSVFVFSATTKPDDAGQWQRYAGYPSVGYAIGFDREAAFCAYIPPLKEKRSVEGTDRRIRGFKQGPLKSIGGWQSVVYSEGQRRALITAYADAFDKQYNKIQSQYSGITLESELSCLTQENLGECLKLERLIKDAAFSTEGEVRLVFSSFGMDRAVRYRASAFGIIPYIEITGSGIEGNGGTPRLPITSVTVGPSPFAHGQTEILRRFLHANGYGEVEVRSSRTPFRGSSL